MQGPGAGVPRNLRPDENYRGTPWFGEPGRLESVAAIMTRQRRNAAPMVEREQHEPGVREDPKDARPGAPEIPRYPEIALASPAVAQPDAAQTLSTSWTAAHQAESGFRPPDSNGSVGPTQVFAAANGRLRVFDKAGNLGPLDVTDAVFFSTVRGASGVSDPHVRYDRLSGRWFVSEITVATPNRILLAVSSTSTITSSTSFAFFQFQQDLVGATPNTDTGGLADYDTLGVDANALYIGANIFKPNNVGGFDFVGTTGFVVNKSNLIGGTLTVTAFRQLSPAIGAGVYTPQGVDNDDPAASEGYFIGVDNAAFSLLQMRRVSNPGGVPSISGNIGIAVPTTYLPLTQDALGSSRPLDALDDRLFAAMIRRNTSTGATSLWTAHNIRVTSAGVGSSSGTRNGSRWYEIGSLTTTPALVQSGTVFDPASSSAVGFWIPSVAVSGQGHMALVASYAGASSYAGVAVDGRLSGDTLGTTRGAGAAFAGAGAYNDSGSGTQRWGDYSQIAVDPADNQTMWAFADFAYSTSTTDAWGVRVIKLLAPPPAALSSASPSSVASGVASVNVTITGVSSGGSAFYDPGAPFPNHISATVSGGVTVNSVTFNNATSVTLNLSTVGASGGTKSVTITNPDGQQASAAIFSVAAPTVLSVSPASGWTGGGTQITVGGTNFVVGATNVTVGGVAATSVSVLNTSALTAFTPAGSPGPKTVTVTTSNGSGSLANGFTYFASLFTDDPLQPGVTQIRATHLNELRAYVDLLRARYGLPAVSWTDGNISPGAVLIRGVHITEIRTALAEVYAAAGRAAPTYTDPALTSATAVKAVHFAELRAAIVAIY